MVTLSHSTLDDSRWQAIVDRDKSADGLFFYAVATTGVFCRPGCASRLPNRENVVCYANCEEALAAGYRPCKRCTPCADSKELEIKRKIIHSCRSIEASEKPLQLKDLAAEANLSPCHFHRLFKKIVGVTPKHYASHHRSRRFQEHLKTGRSVTDAIYSAGFSSNSGPYNKHKNQLSMTPKVYKNGAEGITISYGIVKCFLGWVIVAATERGVCSIEFGDDPTRLPEQLQRRFPQAQLRESGNGFSALIKNVVDFIESPAKELEVPLDIQGTAFQQRVWNILRQIKHGETLSYTEVAEQIGKPKAVRAVAAACAANLLAVLIPCHRVIAKDGKVSGYRWGIERKKLLLETEKAAKARGVK